MNKKILIFLLASLSCVRTIKVSHQDSTIFYSYKQSANGYCLRNDQCDGQRACNFNKCTGNARPNKDIFYYFNEQRNGGYCGKTEEYRKYYCDGQRTCSQSGRCQGTARPQKNITYSYKQQGRCLLSSARNYQIRDYYCDGNRYCEVGICRGDSRTKNVFYLYNESKTSIRCPLPNDTNYKNKDFYCDGQRTCSQFGWCQGVARPPKNQFYYYPQMNLYYCPQDKKTPSYQIKDYYCDAGMFCSAQGYCLGQPRRQKNSAYSYNQSSTSIRCPQPGEPNYILRDYFCDGQRTCSNWGWCQGTARPPKTIFYMVTETTYGCWQSSLFKEYSLMDYFCDGLRTCVFGGCSGVARTKSAAFYFKQNVNNKNCSQLSKENNQFRIKDFYCDGMRTCDNDGNCVGISRPEKNQFYFFNQYKNGTCPKANEENFVIADYFCDGRRKCLSGLCSGLARPPKQSYYYYNQSQTSIRCPINSSVFNYQIRDYYCDGSRTCSKYGFCAGIARPLKSPVYFFDETPRNNQCPFLPTDQFNQIKDYFCDGLRSCQFSGRCSGVARPVIKDSLYYYNEQKTNSRCPENSSDPHYDNRDLFCDGKRTCYDGFCSGNTGRSYFKSMAYYVNETKLGYRCAKKTDYNAEIRELLCDGLRTCHIYGYCIGEARKPKGVNYKYNETFSMSWCPNSKEQNGYPTRDYYCDGLRKCGDDGKCFGKPR